MSPSVAFHWLVSFRVISRACLLVFLPREEKERRRERTEKGGRRRERTEKGVGEGRRKKGGEGKRGEGGTRREEGV